MQTITITELLKDNQKVIELAQKSEDPIAVIKNSQIIFYISKNTSTTPKFKISAKRNKFKIGVKQVVTKEDIYSTSWLDN